MKRHLKLRPLRNERNKMIDLDINGEDGLDFTLPRSGQVRV